MSRGIGKTQRRILDFVNAGDEPSTISEISESLEIPPRQIRTAVQSLHERGLVFAGKGWRGDFREPAISWRYTPEKIDDLDRQTVVAFKGLPWPGKPGKVAPGWGTFVAVEHRMPTGVQLYVHPTREVERIRELHRKIAAIWAGA
ncbi:MarR family transcriptional regulator [Dietzia timorensis]|uniref:Uncharacterized protein n=1 Tax=Dietzia timorensis TaxID=499555 RepID=A0A173LM79_9ACTN|nr:MarR family transcriptional regulator [Dietzia timorensis]ANI91680.1 Hypothetical protein BJL86_0886 [Dietzia timorensis]